MKSIWIYFENNAKNKYSISVIMGFEIPLNKQDKNIDC